MDNRLYHRLCKLGPDGQRAAFAAAMRSEDDDLARAVLRREDLPQDVLEDARNCPRPAVQAAWLLRPGRTREELCEAVDRERRGEVLAAVAQATEDRDLRRRVARTRKRPVALVLASSNDMDVLAEVLPVLDAWCQNKKVPRQAASALAQAVSGADEATLAKVDPELGSLDAMSAVARKVPSERALLDHLLVHLVALGGQEAASWDWDRRRMAGTALVELVENPYLTREDLGKVQRGLASAPGARALHGVILRATERADEVGDGAVPGPDQLLEELACDDHERVRAAWRRCTGRQRFDYAQAVADNTLAPADVHCQAVQVRCDLFEQLAGVVDVETCVYVAQHGNARTVLTVRADVRDEVVAELLEATKHPWELERFADSLTREELLEGPWSLVGRAGIATVDSYLVEELSGKPQAWEMFDRLQGSWPGSARSLVATCKAAVA